MPQKFLRGRGVLQPVRIYFGPENEAFTPAYKAAQTVDQERSGISVSGKARSSTPLHPNKVTSLEKVSVGAILAADVVTSKGALLISQGQPLTAGRLKKLRGLADAHPEIQRIRITVA